MKKIVFLAILAVSLFFGSLMPTLLKAEGVDPFNNCTSGSSSQCFSVCATAPDSTVCKASNEAKGKNSVYGKGGILTKVVEILGYITGVAAVVVIIISGIKYVTSNGDAGGVASAKNGIIYAIVGLVVALFAETIVAFVLNKL